MGLRTYKHGRTVVPLGGETLTIRGLSLTDVSELVGKHLSDIDTLMEAYENKTADIFAKESGDILIRMLANDAPQIAGKLIALASDEAEGPEELEELAAVAAKIPFPVQIEALMAIAKHTFEDAGGPKEFFKRLGALRGVAKDLIPTKRTT